MKYIITLNGKQFEVEVERGKATAVYTGSASAVPVPTAAPAAAAPAAPMTQATPAGAGEGITAPMPGNILDVRCTAGQTVKAGDILFILEAMKMENEICAPRDGTVTSVTAAKNAAVETGTVLCTLA